MAGALTLVFTPRLSFGQSWMKGNGQALNGTIAAFRPEEKRSGLSVSRFGQNHNGPSIRRDKHVMEMRSHQTILNKIS
jgi:hypothetical protein